MANLITTQLIDDGPKNTVIKLSGILDTADIPYTIFADPATLSYLWPDAPQRANTLRIMAMEYNVEDALEVRFWWDVDGTQANAKLVDTYAGRGKFNFKHFGYLPNNAVAPTGKIAYSTEGWFAGAKLSYTMYVELVKG